MSSLDRVYRVYRARGLAVIAVNFKESKEVVRAFMSNGVTNTSEQ